MCYFTDFSIYSWRKSVDFTHSVDREMQLNIDVVTFNVYNKMVSIHVTIYDSVVLGNLSIVNIALPGV